MATTNGTFDAYKQNITFLAADGSLELSTTVMDIDEWSLYNVQACVLYGAQIGAALMMFLVTAILTKPEKRATPVFILNMLALFLALIRGILLSVFFMTGWNEFLNTFAGDYSRLDTAPYADSVSCTVTIFLFATTVISSLVLQAYTVTKTLSRQLHLILTIISAFLLLVATGFRFLLMVENSIAIMKAEALYGWNWLLKTNRALECTQIFWFACIFTFKLVATLWSRKKMGLKRWSNLQILIASGTCTMIIPSGFAILYWVHPQNLPQGDTLAIFIVALMLPLTSLWASMATMGKDTNFSLGKLWASNRSAHTCTSCGESCSDTTLAGSFSNKSNGTKRTAITLGSHGLTSNNRDSTELELQALGAGSQVNGVRVDRSYSVHSEHNTAITGGSTGVGGDAAVPGV